MRKITALLCVLLASSTEAEMLNVSSNNYANYESPNVACTIVQGYGEFVATAEALSVYMDPIMFISSVPDTGGEVLVNDDWIDYTFAERQIIINAIGRPLGRATDSAIVFWAQNIGICAFASALNPGSPLVRVNVGITETVFPRARINQSDGFGIIIGAKGTMPSEWHSD